LRRDFPFELIHAHFAYPDGVVAAWLGKRYGVPVVVTEHACWHPWMDQYPLVRRQAVNASRTIAAYLAVSRHVRSTIADFTGSPDRIRIVPVGVDHATFSPADPVSRARPEQLLYVGFINLSKGIDVLLHAMSRLRARRPAISLVLVGGSFYQNSEWQRERLVRMARDLKLESFVTFVGPKPPQEVARYMRESALLVLPSRRESFGAVLVEALACGTPVVATRCGGPEDIVTKDVGVLVEPENPEALARGIEDVLDNRNAYSAGRLRRHALERFSWERVVKDTAGAYREAVAAQVRNEQRELAAALSNETTAPAECLRPVAREFRCRNDV
jgi:glycosyltransferase involved in cell wall biosynthesis